MLGENPYRLLLTTVGFAVLFFGFLIVSPAYAEEDFLERINSLVFDPSQNPVTALAETEASRFELENPTWSNLVFEAPITIKLGIIATPDKIFLHFLSVNSQSETTTLNVSGLAPSRTYYLYQDGVQEETIVTTDSTGSFSYLQKISQEHFVWIQKEPAGTVFITETTVLTGDILDTVAIVADNITLDCNGHKIIPPSGDGVLLTNRTGVTVRNCLIEITSISGGGVFIFGGANNRLENLTVIGATTVGYNLFNTDANRLSSVTGVADPGSFANLLVIFADDNLISDSSFSGTFDTNVEIFLSKGNIIRNSEVIGRFPIPPVNHRFGIIILGGNSPDRPTINNKIVLNEIIGHTEGIGIVEDANQNIIEDNTITGVTGTDIGIFIGSSSGNEIKGNFIELSRLGVFLRFSSGNLVQDNNINFDSIVFLDSSFNQVFHNNFIANFTQAFVLGGTGNLFDNGPTDGGNYWSVYDTPAEGCNDTDADGNCDAPFVFSGGQDNFPWTTQDGWEGGVALNVPHYTQRISQFPSFDETESWAAETYANGRGNLGPENERCGLTITQCGCSITSAVMIARFYDATIAQGEDVQPLNLNNWLNDNEGYDDFGNFLWRVLGPYTDDQVLFVGANDTANNFSLLDQRLNNGEPLIAKALAGRGGSPNVAPTHFFVIDGKRADDSYSVKDPFWFNTANLTEPITDRNLALRNYEGGFDGLRIYTKGDGVVASSLSITLSSPAELLLTDSLGRRVGKDPTANVTFDEIPGASYFADSIGDPTGEASPTGHVLKTIYILEPPDDDYTLEVIGTDSGSYALAMTTVNNDGELNETKTSGVTDTDITSLFETSFSSTTTEAPPLTKEVSFESIQKDIEIALQIGIIDSRGIANSLLQKLDVAEKNLQKDRPLTAQNVLNALEREIKAQKEKHINEPFVSILLQDIDILSNSLPPLANSLSLLLANLYTALSQLLALLSNL